MFVFNNPEYFFLLAVLPFLIYDYIKKHSNKEATVRFSNIAVFKKLKKSKKQTLRHSLFVMRMIVLILVITAIARPRSSFIEQKIEAEGIDIILALDVSSSMKAEDFKPANRLEAAKAVARDFIKGRTNDRIGMVVFSGRAYTQAPLTMDYGILLSSTLR